MGVQTNRVLDNLQAILKGAGCSLTDTFRAERRWHAVSRRRASVVFP